MTPPHMPGAERMIEVLREIQELARIDIAKAEGGELSQITIRALGYWLARAWEAGNAYEKERQRLRDVDRGDAG